MKVKCDRKLLASKGLDLLLWKTIRVSNFEQEEKAFYQRVNECINSCIERYDVTQSYHHLLAHYTSCLLSVQFANWDSEPKAYSYWKSASGVDVTHEEHEFTRDESDYDRAFSTILHLSERRLNHIKPSVVYEIFLAVIQQIKQHQIALPESAHLDFVTSNFLISDEFGCLNFLTTMIREPICYIRLPENKLSGQLINDYSVMLRLVLIEEFNQLAKVIFHMSLYFKWHVITDGDDVIPNSEFMPLFKYQFQNPIAQGVLCDVLNNVKASIPMLTIVDKQIDSSNDEIEFSVDELDEITYRSLHFCFNDYQFNLFAGDSGNPIRIEKIVNTCASYYMKFFYDCADELKELYRKAKYVQATDSSKLNTQQTGDSKPLPTISSFMNRYLANEHGINIPPKKIWLTHKAIEKDNMDKNVMSQWDEASKNRKRLRQEWFETQIQINFLPKSQLQPQGDLKPTAKKLEKSLIDPLLSVWGRESDS